eukprot:CAMPEP_0202381582 /NCGR_PEP_ID=MMETSP1127-20130417/36906_1 /ASSEMBLY_ACC=CAM_ASM_000462 /TAXON_ID=3047 /ORGANISM="Dunaliella tertiolecta, Strain CCMP1320" /LENGTH=66 /DNA_ID=CAMNT_0048980593 /DNA_START=21 /DNA_END=218 /DNA_ORIENTATION=-
MPYSTGIFRRIVMNGGKRTRVSSPQDGSTRPWALGTAQCRSTLTLRAQGPWQKCTMALLLPRMNLM